LTNIPLHAPGLYRMIPPHPVIRLFLQAPSVHFTYPSASTGSFQPTIQSFQGNFVTILFALFAWWYSLI
jgi:hypothetical protein